MNRYPITSSLNIRVSTMHKFLKANYLYLRTAICKLSIEVLNSSRQTSCLL